MRDDLFCEGTIRTPHRTLLRRLIVVVFGAVTLLATVAAPVSAHAILRSTSPADGEDLDAAPASVRLEFNEPVSTSAGGIRVFDDQGARVDAGDAETPTDSLESVEVGLRDGLPEGTYVVSWRALSADAHPVHGAFVFNVGEASIDDAVVSEILERSSDTGLQTAATVLRFLQYAAALVAAGGVAFLVKVHDRAESERAVLIRTVVRAGVAVIVLTVVSVAVQASLVTGLGFAGALGAASLSDVMQSTFGLSSVALLVGAAILVTGARRLWDGWAVTTAGVGAVLLIASFALTGHTATSTPRWLVVSADIAHALAGAAWFGGLALLVLSLRSRRAADDPVGGGAMVARFSTMATWSIVVVTVAGFALSWVEVRALRALRPTGYGVTLLVKTGLVGAVLLIGAYNKRRLVPAIKRAEAHAWERLRTLVTLEVAGLLLVVAVTAVLVNLIPARDAAGITGPLSVRSELGADHLVDITVEPNRVGTNEMHIYLFGEDGRTADAESISVGLLMPSNDVGPIERDPSPTGPGHWTVTDADFPIAGRWIVTITAATSRFDEATAEIPIDVGG